LSRKELDLDLHELELAAELAIEEAGSATKLDEAIDQLAGVRLNEDKCEPSL